MGQSSTFLTNRQGDFQFWNDVWDSKESYQKSNLENILIKSCLSIFLKNKNYVNWRFFFIKNLNFWSNFFFLNTKPHELEDYWIEQKDIKKNTISIITCFIFKYQGWFVFFIYYHVVKKFINNKKKNEINLNEELLNEQADDLISTNSEELNKDMSSENTDDLKESTVSDSLKNNVLNKNKTLEYFESDAYDDDFNNSEFNFEEFLNSEIDFEYYTEEEEIKKKIESNLSAEVLDFLKKKSDDTSNFVLKEKINLLLNSQVEDELLKPNETINAFDDYSFLISRDYDDVDSYILNFFQKKNKDIIKNGENSDEEKEKEKNTDDEERENEMNIRRRLFERNSDSDTDSDDDYDDLYGGYYRYFNSLDNNFTTYLDFF